MLDEFVKTPHVEDDELLFATRLADFESKADRSNGRDRGRVRQNAKKTVPESYHIERAKREKEEEARLIEK